MISIVANGARHATEKLGGRLRPPDRSLPKTCDFGHGSNPRPQCSFDFRYLGLMWENSDALVLMGHANCLFGLPDGQSEESRRAFITGSPLLKSPICRRV